MLRIAGRKSAYAEADSPQIIAKSLLIWLNSPPSALKSSPAA
jgi:hypothetical protein